MRALNRIEKVYSRIRVTRFNSNPKATIILCYSPTNVSLDEDVTEFYESFSNLTRDIPPT
uniref:Uncharacterized protein n=1 Tax=Octopus bimaculoides TaxID=37653 RepID=A0A0L8IBQ6_OCTBM